MPVEPNPPAQLPPLLTALNTSTTRYGTTPTFGHVLTNWQADNRRSDDFVVKDVEPVGIGTNTPMHLCEPQSSPRIQV